MRKRTVVMCLIILSGCGQKGMLVGEENAPSVASGKAQTIFNEDELSRIISLNGRLVEEVVGGLVELQSAHQALSSEEIASQLDQRIEIRCDSTRCEIGRKGDL